ncbi:DUF6247 family protein [Streptomyces montanisoli]|uniref:Transmembrane protein n=1 Tax=Streptomyces montanisoli TaxID=2798581 RepID=A0A940MAQ1_9ACTN|nr:DUF6247 family protein [Streptomyces montanisoli]MBP0459435.1 hypothetical protein [Streptomyces montanisoli]
MKSAPHLLGEDRAEFERTLDEALRTAHERAELAGLGDVLTTRQLRAMALDAQQLIAQAAAPEYERYREVREELRTPRSPHAREAAPPAPSEAAPDTAPPPSASPPSPSPSGHLPGSSVLGDPARTGAGVVAVVAVLVPVLAAIAAVIFLLAGYLLKAVGPAHALAGALIAFGWFFASVMALGILAGGIGLVITALRNGSTQIRSADEARRLGDARDEWRAALLERGIVPYLRRALREADTSAPMARWQGQGEGGQLPKIGYSRPDFSSPGEGAARRRGPRYSSPDFTSPDYGGPDHQPD